MKTITKITVIAVSLLCPSIVLANTAIINSSIQSKSLHLFQPKEDSLRKAEKGTYEIISLSKQEELFTKQAMDDLLMKIEKERHESRTVTIQVSKYTAVKIYPKNDLYGRKENQ